MPENQYNCMTRLSGDELEAAATPLGLGEGAAATVAGADMNLPIGFVEADDEVLRRAYRDYINIREGIDSLVPAKIEILGHYDVPGMTSAAAICHWGRSGSFLLGSLLDSHADMVQMPWNTSEPIYDYWNEYGYLSLWEKLVVYPSYLIRKHGSDCMFGQGNYSVAAQDYFAAVHALFSIYGNQPQPWLATRQRFVQFLHATTAVAAGQRPANSRPMMVISQHFVSETLARYFIEDFPTGRFIHTIRDPISTLDSWFDRHCHMQLELDRLDAGSKYRFPAFDAVNQLLSWDVAHLGMDSKSRAVRFEDMHLETEATMRRLAAWLGIPYRASLLESTYNGAPYAVESGGTTWVGANPANARRRWKHLGRLDRLMTFALFHKNFIAWKYPSPRFLGNAFLRCSIIAALWCVPMRIELVNARLVLRRQALPDLRRGCVAHACALPFMLVLRRMRLMYVVGTNAILRNLGSKPLLRVV